MRQTSHWLSEAQYRDPVNNRRSSIRRVRITTPQFLQHQARNENLKKRPAVPPLIRRHLLMGGRHQIPAGRGRQIADDRGFEVNAQFSFGSHHAQSTLLPRRVKPTPTQACHREAHCAIPHNQCYVTITRPGCESWTIDFWTIHFRTLNKKVQTM